VNLCALCADSGKTCCQQTDILLTQGDLRRIEEHTRTTDFFEFRPPRDPGALGDDGDPNWLAYTLRGDGRRRVLRQEPGGNCRFLTVTGCSLPLETRPLICRLHPVTYTEAGLAGVCPECPSHLAPAETDLLASIGMDLVAARCWHRQLYDELRDDVHPLGRAA
jgi:Fe-S-cluster containining protein